MAAAAADCPICAEKFNKSTLKPIVCSFCSFEACIKCCSRFVLDSVNDPTCMKCSHAWSRDFLLTSFTKKFVNETLKKRREELLFERERGMLPATQSYVERLKKLEEAEHRLAELQRLKAQIKRQVEEVSAEVWTLKREMNNAADVVQERRQYVRQCPAEGCNGFLSTKWKCGICNVRVCPDCHEIKSSDAEHTCKPEFLETAKLLAKESKPCPSCGVPICKIDGCNQMWCTSCHKAWHWATGRIETGRIHNPHYIAYVNAERGGMVREHNDIPCGGLPVTRNLARHLNQLGASSSMSSDILGKLRHAIHVWDVEAERFRVDNLTDNLDLRAKYMLNQLDEGRFKTVLQQREKANQKKREYYLVLMTFRDVCVDIFTNMMNTRQVEDLPGFMEDFDNVWNHTVQSMCETARKYNSTVPRFVYMN